MSEPATTESKADEMDREVHRIMFGTDVGWRPEPASMSRKPKRRVSPR